MHHNQDFTDELHAYFANGLLQHYPKNTLIVGDNEQQKIVYFIKSGYVRVHADNGRGEEYTHIVYGAGEIFPLIWLTRQQNSANFCRTLTETELYAVPLETFNHDLIEKKGFANAMLRQAVEQYRIYAMRVANL